MLAGCKDAGTTVSPTEPVNNGESTSLGSGEIILFNLMQAGKQLSTDLLGRIVAAPGAAGLSPADLALVTAIRDQQRVHRDALKAIANANRTNANSAALNLPDLPADFAAVDFNQRDTVLTAAHTLLNTLVAGGAGTLRYASRASTMTVLGQILSVDARHAATLARLLPAASLTDLQDGTPTYARNRALRLSELAAALNLMITFGSRLVTNNLP